MQYVPEVYWEEKGARKLDSGCSRELSSRAPMQQEEQLSLGSRRNSAAQRLGAPYRTAFLGVGLQGSEHSTSPLILSLPE